MESSPEFSNSLTMSSESLESLKRDTFVQAVQYHAKLNSTNTHALQCIAAESKLQAPLLVFAEAQTAGRGRGDHRWWSGAGALSFSIVLDAAQFGIAPQDQSALSLVVALAVRDACQHGLGDGHDRSSQDVGRFEVKWPNDVFLNGRKVAGILIETTAARPGLLVIGVGINVNNTFADAPTEVKDAAIAMIDVSETFVDCPALVRGLLQRFEQGIVCFAQDPESFVRAWSRHCLLTGKNVTLAMESARASGVCRGIDDHGALLLETATGLHRFHAGTVEDWFSMTDEEA